MQHADALRVPFWSAPSVHDVPLIVLDWIHIRAEAEAEAAEQIRRREANSPRVA